MEATLKELAAFLDFVVWFWMIFASILLSVENRRRQTAERQLNEERQNAKHWREMHEHYSKLLDVERTRMEIALSALRGK